MRVLLLSGSRDWTNKGVIWETLDHARTSNGGLTIIAGGARGADRIAAEWARLRGADLMERPAAWQTHHPDWCPGDWCQQRHYCVGAGPRRNQTMVDLAVELEAEHALCFKETFNLRARKGGTEDLARRASTAGMDVFLHNGDSWSVVAAPRLGRVAGPPRRVAGPR